MKSLLTVGSDAVSEGVANGWLRCCL
jgi:hypothetical protein